MLVISGTARRRKGSRLTPGEAHAAAFPSSRPGRRGLDEDQVRAFVGQVEQELTQLRGERNMLTDEVQRLRRRVLTGDTETGPGPREEAQVDQAAAILSTAQRTADRCVASAEEYSRQLADDAQLRRDEILAEARSQAALMLEQAHTAASRAAEAALGAGPGPDRREPGAGLAYLYAFSDAYRAHLDSCLGTPACGTGEPGRAEPAPRAVRPGQPWALCPQPQSLTG